MGAVMGVCGGLGSFRGGYGVARVAVVGPCVELVGPFGGRLWGCLGRLCGPVWRSGGLGDGYGVIWGQLWGPVWRFGGLVVGYRVVWVAVVGPCVEVVGPFGGRLWGCLGWLWGPLWRSGGLGGVYGVLWGAFMGPF